MNRTFLFLLVLLILWILLGIFVVRKYCCVHDSTAATTAVMPSSAQSSVNCASELTIADGNFKLSSSDHFRFIESSFNLLPSSAQLSAVIEQTADYLNNQANRQLVITGYYGPGENNSSILGNLGLARANSIKRSLMQVGAQSNQIDIASDQADPDCFKEDTLLLGGTFTFQAMAESSDRLAAILDSTQKNPVTLYFDTGADQINLTAQQRQKFTDIIYYLDNVPDAIVQVSGHTDNTGQPSTNRTLSEERANFVKNYLTSNGGIRNTRIESVGYGPDRPIASNDTPEGRALNRRVEVTLN